MSKKWCAAQEAGYTWYFDRQLPGDDHGAWHSADLWYWFGTLDNCWRPMEEKDYALSREMVGYLCSFVRTGDPNGQGRAQWLPSKKERNKVLIFGENTTQMKKPGTLKMVFTMLTNKAPGE
jgi:para-nitrobenzyl esterase